MGSDRPGTGKRLQHRLVAAGLRALDAVAGGTSPGLRASARYLTGLIDQGRHGEVDALLAQGARKMSGQILSGKILSGKILARLLPARPATLIIDAATQRLAPGGGLAPGDGLAPVGGLISKPAWRYPSPEAPLLVSVVIPCFNYGRFVREAVRSAREQTLSCLEVIVVDDGSTDAATVATLDELARQGEVLLIRQPNQGLPAARNTGIAAARGEYVCCLDADDLIDPTYLEAAIALMRTDASLGFAYSHVRFFGDVEEVWETRDFDIEEALVANFTAVSAVFRRDDWHEAGGYAAAMRGGFEDWEFWIRLACLGRRGRAIRHPLFLHRRHGRTMTHEAKEMQEELHGRIRALNPAAFADAALRRRLRGLAGPARDSDAALQALATAVAPDHRPGLLVVVAWLRRGGAEALLLSILRALAPHWRIVIATTERDPHLMSDAFHGVTREIFHLEAMLDAGSRRAFLSHLVASRRVTRILSSGSAWVLGVLPAIRAGAPGELACVNIVHNEMPDSVFRALVAAGTALDRHVAISRPVEALLLGAGIDPQRVIRIANGIDPAPLTAAAARREALRAARGLGKDDILLAWVGRLSVEKRPEAFIDIVAALKARMNIRATLAGEGPLVPETQARAMRAGLQDVITFAGHLPPDSVGELLAAADMLVLTSAVEGLPLIVLEALAAGCPVAATQVGDVDSVVHDGVDGVLVAAGRPLDLADRIADALAAGLSTPAHRAAIQARFAESPHTRAAMTDAYTRLMEDPA